MCYFACQMPGMWPDVKRFILVQKLFWLIIVKQGLKINRTRFLVLTSDATLLEES